MIDNNLIYVILNEIKKGNISFNYKNFGVEQEFFADTLRLLGHQGFYNGELHRDDDVYYLKSVTLRKKGIEFLDNYANF